MAGMKKAAPKVKSPAAPNRPQLDKMSVGKAGGKGTIYSKGEYKLGKLTEREIEIANAIYAYVGGRTKYPNSGRYKSQFELGGANKRKGGK